MRRNARESRRTPTRVESKLWRLLRDRRFDGFKFRRQVPIGPYVLDFYSPGLKLAIEADGRHHETAWMSEYDSERSWFLSRRGIEVLRLSNELVIRDPRLVTDSILFAIEQRLKR
jgi:very-short-patch-repair endonuclease